MIEPDSCCILNGGDGSWAFAALARRLSDALWLDVSTTPRAYNYALFTDEAQLPSSAELFIPLRSMELATDKRLLADRFVARKVPTPETRLLGSPAEVEQLLTEEPGREWCLKFPTGCGGSGHRMLSPGGTVPMNWPRPLVVQEFVRLERPEVFRLYGAGGHLFGWVARRFPAGAQPSPWVAHARGARYEPAGDPPDEAVSAARSALDAVGLLGSFGCVDLLRRPTGEWLVLEVGTDGMFNHVDRDLGLPDLEREIQQRLAEAFWARAGARPWGNGHWRPRHSIDA